MQTFQYRVGVRYLLALLYSFLVSSVEIIAILHLIIGPRIHVAAALFVAMAVAIIGASVMAFTLSSDLEWYAAGTVPTPQQRSAAATLPFRHARMHAIIWVVIGVALIAVHHDAAANILVLVGICVIGAGAATGFMGFLLLQRVLRPVFDAALSGGTAPPPRRHQSVGTRLLVTWGLYSAIPLAGIAGIVLGAHFDWLIPSGAAIGAPVLILAAVGLVAGVRGMTLAARSVSDPLREVTGKMGRVGAGHYAARTRVYDSSEIGILQAGFNEMVAGLAERERMRELFGRHVGRDVAQHALERGGDFTGRVCETGVVFIDLAGSTALAASSAPDHVAAVLNSFFRIVVGIINEHGGYINKFAGDAALAIFGAPLPLADPAARALAAARSLHDALSEDSDMPDFGIGVTCGRVFAGNIGAEDRYEYTVIGDPVNEAARLSDLAKCRSGRILASATAVTQSGASEQIRWRTKEEVLLRGRKDLTTLAEPVTGTSSDLEESE
ncbi:adenylate cyclase [Mycobacterium sp. MAA66]|uniref:adenylate/guanylate cyclase domain-containing protein n=1 Tax=Mycobacterium sp. MAA66 TaxID=3156297 RepID=UPI0035165C39